MHKRVFLTTAATATASLLAQTKASAASGQASGPTLLTVTGAVAKSNRSPFDPALDHLMSQHGVKFSKAFVFDAASLQRLPVQTIQPTLEYDGKVHTLSGPLLAAVLEAAGADTTKNVQLGLRALDGYNVQISFTEANANRMLVATHLDGQPMALGGLGPQWAVWDADRLPSLKNKPLKERFGPCPWGLYLIDVNQG